MRVLRFSGTLEADDTITHVKGVKYRRKYETTIEPHREPFKTAVPDNFRLVFHNSLRGFNWGGWHTGNYPTKIDQAAIFVNDGLTDHRFNLAPRKMGWSVLGLFQLFGESIPNFVKRAIDEAQDRVAEITQQLAEIPVDYWRCLSVQHQVFVATQSIGEKYHRTGVLFPRGALYTHEARGVVALNTPEKLAKIEQALLERGFRYQPDVPQTPECKRLIFANVPVELRPVEQLGKTVFSIGSEGYYVEEPKTEPVSAG